MTVVKVTTPGALVQTAAARIAAELVPLGAEIFPWARDFVRLWSLDHV